MKSELVSEFEIPDNKVSVIPFGINNTVPNTGLSSAEAKRQLGINSSDKAMLFFGNIAPYKGLEYLVAAFDRTAKERPQLSAPYRRQAERASRLLESDPSALHRAAFGDRIIQALNTFRTKKRNYISKRLTF